MVSFSCDIILFVICNWVTCYFTVGYETVAINRNVEENVFDSEKKKKKKGNSTDPVICPLPPPPEIKDLVDEFKGKLNILTRITFAYSDPVRTHALVVFSQIIINFL